MDSGQLVVGHGRGLKNGQPTHYWEIQKRLDRWDALLKDLSDKIDWMWMCLKQSGVPWEQYIKHPSSPWNKK